MIAFYYALSGFACVIYYRHELRKSIRNLLFIGVAPLVGALILAYLLVRSIMDLSDPEASYSGSSVLGVGLPLFIGAAFLAFGAVFMVVWRPHRPPGVLPAAPVRGAPAGLRAR